MNFKKILIIVFLNNFLFSIGFTLEPDVFVQSTDHKYAKVIDILSKEFFLSEQGIKNILQKMKRK